MSISDAFQQYYSELVEKLPMDDAIFVSYVNGLFCGDQKDCMQEKGTRTKKAQYFLDEIMKVDLDKYFNTLLTAMTKYGGAAKTLSSEIMEKIGKGMCKLCDMYTNHEIFF